MKAFIVVLVAVLIALTGCSGAGNSNGASSGSKQGEVAVGRAPKAADGAGAAAGTAPVRLAPAQAIVYTADLSMRAGDVSGAAAQAKGIVAAAGGYVGSENASDDPGLPPVGRPSPSRSHPEGTRGCWTSSRRRGSAGVSRCTSRPTT